MAGSIFPMPRITESLIMAIDSVSSSAYAGASRQTTENRQTQQTERPEPKAQQRTEPQEVQEAPKPVKNAQGQTTGTVINTTA